MKHNPERARVILDGVDVIVEGARILSDIVWRLEPGERWGVVGPNGSGKSTLLRLIAGEAWPAPGKGARRYDFGAGPERDAVRARTEIVLVGHELQDRYTRFGWNFTALDVVLSGLHRTDVPRRRPSRADTVRARAAMRELGLLDLAARPFLELSRGEQRRVLIARGFAFRPAVLLLDEPASGLDAAARDRLTELIDRIGAATPLVCAAHAREDLPSIVNRVAALDGGRIVGDAASTPERSTRSAPDRPSGPPRSALDRPSAPAPAQRGKPRTAAAGSSSAAAGSSSAATGLSSAATEPAIAAPEPASPAPERGNAAPLIAVEHASVWLGDRRVLHEVSWYLHEGEHWLIRGPNGAGKSSFLRLLHGQLRPARGGRVQWPGLGAPADVWRLRRRVAWVSAELQAAYWFPASVRQCLASGFTSSIGQTRRPSTEESERIEQLLEDFELGGLDGRRLASLSYGQRRRVLIARALAPRPRVLLLDEPWEGLDAATAALVQSRLAAAAAAGMHLVCVSHLEIGEALFSRELLLEGGRIAAAGARPLRTPRDDARGARFESYASAPPPARRCPRR